MTALCSPTRVALKSGRNHHTANAGSIMETATAFPGNTGQIPNSVAPLAEMLYQLIYDGVIKVDHPKMKDYHFTVDMTNQAINWVKAQQSMSPTSRSSSTTRPGAPRAAPRAEGVGRQVQGAVRQGLGPGPE